MEFLVTRKINEARCFEDTEESLIILLSSGCQVWTEDDGTKTLIETRVRVDSVKGLKIYIYAKDHSPPHFHVLSGDIDATFTIMDGTLLHGRISNKHSELISWWYQTHRDKLISIWDDTRPTDCPVGPIKP